LGRLDSKRILGGGQEERSDVKDKQIQFMLFALLY
jgi:hypothetical protein